MHLPSTSTWGSRFGAAALNFPLLAFPWVVVLLVYPLAVFNRNASEFGHAPETLAPFWIAAAIALGLCGLTALLLAFIPSGWRNAVGVLMLWLGCCFILNDLVTPVRLTKAIGFDGTERIVPAAIGFVVLDGALLLGSLLLLWRGRDTWVPRIAPPGVVLFSLITLGPSGYEFISTTRQLRQSASDSPWISTPPPSPKHVDHPNVYHIILDGFRGSMFRNALAEAGLTEADFAGFIYYPKNRSNFDGTQTSTPVFLTGTLYHGGSFRRWHNSWTDTGLFPVVKTQFGTDIQAYSTGAYYQLTRWIQGRKIEHADTLPKNQGIILRLSLARATPAFLRAPLFQPDSGKFSRWLIPPATDSRLQALQTLLLDEPLRAAQGKYVFAHLYFPHAPFLVDRSGAPSAHASLLSQSAYALRRTADFLAGLKRSGHFDSSIIVIHSDHGWGDQVPAEDGQPVPEGIQIESWPRSAQELNNWTSALLLIKPAGVSSASPFTVSPRPTQLLDLPNTIYDLLGLPQSAPEGKSVLARDYPADSERHVFTGYRRWSQTQKRQLWFGQDFFDGEFNHLVWTDAGGWKVLPPQPVTWEASPLVLPPDGITVLAAHRPEATVIELTWPATANQGEFEIQMASATGEFTTIGRGAAGPGSYTVGSLAKDGTYRFRARWSVNHQVLEWSSILTLPPP